MNNLDKIQKLEHAQLKLEARRQELLSKALSSSDPELLLKANAFLGQGTAPVNTSQKSYLVDPFDFQNSLGFKEKAHRLSYTILENMAKEPIVNSIIRTRVMQVSSFAMPREDNYSIGFYIRKKPRISAEQDEPTKQELKEIEFLTEFFLNCGKTNDWNTEDFDSFIRKIIRDSLIYDQSTFEVIRDRKYEPVRFFAVDASTFRVSSSIFEDDKNIGSRKKLGYHPSHVQVYQNQVIEEYWPWELGFGVRNPTASIRNYGYGVSELEDLIQVITSLLHGQQHNSTFFTNGSHPKGMFKVSSNVNPSKFQSFRQQWNATMKGVYNAWRTPFLEADKIEWIDLQKTNRDMEWSNWIEFLIKVSSAIYTIDPAEVNFPLQGGTSQSSLFQGDNEKRLQHSRNKGLKPLLTFLERKLNRMLTNTFFEGKYELKFGGINANTPQEEIELDIKAASNLETVNEVRLRRGKTELEGGDIILNPNFMQAKSMEAFAGSGEEGGFEEEENPFEQALNDYLTK